MRWWQELVYSGCNQQAQFLVGKVYKSKTGSCIIVKKKNMYLAKCICTQKKHTDIELEILAKISVCLTVVGHNAFIRILP